MDHKARISSLKRVLAGLQRFGRPAQSRANWQYLAAYWSLRKRLRLISFHVLRTRHSLGARASSSRESAQIVLLILRSVGWPFLFAVLLVIAIAFIDFGLKWFINSTETFASHWAFLAVIYRDLKRLHLDSGAAAALLGTLAQIAGIFLGLYFAVVGTLVSTRYASVPPNVRELMIADKLGNQYIKLVALFGAVATLLLVAQSLGIPFGLLNLAFVALLGVATILSFILLGRRAFEFFDPGALLNQLGSELIDWINRATRLRYFGRQRAFQAHYQQQADRLLSSYEGVVRLAAQDETSQRHTLPFLAMHTLGILTYYGRRKSQLAGDSYWFRRQYEHKNWLTASFTETNIALRTGTALRPNEVPDLGWFEAETTEIFWFAYQKLLDGAKLGQAAQVSLSAAETLGRMGEHLLLTEAVQFTNAWAPVFRGEAAKTKLEEPTSKNQQDDLAQRLGIVECYSLGIIRLLLSFVAAVSGEQSETFRKSLSEPDWLSGDRIYAVKAPRTVISELEQLQKLVDFEQQVEGVRRTTSWYLRQRVAFAYCAWYRESFDALLTLFESTFGGDLENLVRESCWLAAAALSGRALEGCNKFRNSLNALRKSYDAWMEWRGRAEGDWPTVNWDDATGRIDKLEERIEIAASALLSPLSRYPKSDVLPDFFGHALGNSTQACFEAIVFDRDQQFAKMFPALFIASLAAVDRLRKELKDSPPETNVIFSTEPIENLMELAGYALVYSELGPKNTWKMVKETWDSYFATRSDAKATSQWLATVISVRRGGFALNPGDMQRSSWKQHFERDMRRRGLLADRWSGSPWERNTEKGHASPVVRALLRGGDVFSDLSDVFLVEYLLKQSFTIDAPVTQKTESFADALEREIKKSPGSKDEEAQE